MIRWAIALVVLTTAIAFADPESDAHDRYRLAIDRTDVGALEELGRARPITRWTDDAWAAAARLAERAGDLARARADLAQVVATAEDEVVRARAEAAIARLAAIAGDRGQWDAVVVRHDALAAAILGAGGDPTSAIAELEALVRANPAYPGATAARLVVAQGWEREGEGARGIAMLDEAIAAAPTKELQGRARYAAFRARLHARDLDGARADLDAIARGDGDRFVVDQLEHDLDVARFRERVRIGAWCVLGAFTLLAVWLARRDAGAWRAVARALVPPPTEVWYLGPLMVVLALVAQGGNPLVARAIRAIGACGVGIAWLSGSSLQLARVRGPLAGRRIAAHIAVVAVALGAMVFLVVDRDRMIDLLVETWRSGPALP